MIIPGASSALKNVESNFYYNGLEISKINFDITEFAKICDIINDLKYQLSRERNLEEVREKYKVLIKTPLYQGRSLFTSAYKEKCFSTMYNNAQKSIDALTKEDFLYFTEDLFLLIAQQMDTLALQAKSGIVLPKNDIISKIKKRSEILIFTNYQHNIEQLTNCFYRTSELEFINGFEDYIYTDEQLKNALTEI